ncbi:HEPN domain-containing protein [Candidatus Woesearchaeota archaeon]|nr:HEPN domain-containing protein [Candidatus Woesearchaeota archaeon]
MAYKARYDYLNNKEELEKEVEEHKTKGSIFEEKEDDQPQVNLNFNRAENEIKLAEAMFKISEKNELKKELELLQEDTFYSGVITHSYYAIFYATKALLLKEKIRTKSPNVHKATLDAFANFFVINCKLDLELLKIYRSAIIKADSLLGLFISEKDKRGEFTYQKLPDANKEPADDSVKNATTFLSHIKKLIQAESRKRG